jgi:hypothetical protein
VCICTRNGCAVVVDACSRNSLHDAIEERVRIPARCEGVVAKRSPPRLTRLRALQGQRTRQERHALRSRGAYEDRRGARWRLLRGGAQPAQDAGAGERCAGARSPTTSAIQGYARGELTHHTVPRKRNYTMLIDGLVRSAAVAAVAKMCGDLNENAGCHHGGGE